MGYICVAAALCAFAIGCGRVGFDPPNAGTLTVATARQVRTSITPLPDVPIVVSDADGRLQDVLMSSGGVDTIAVESGWTITAVFPATPMRSRAQVHVITNVEPGDQLTFGLRESDPGSTLFTTMTVNVPATGDPVFFAHPCGLTAAGVTTTAMISLLETCVQSSFTMLVTSYGIGNVYAVVPVTWSDGGVIDVTSFVPASTLDLEVTSVPPSATLKSVSVDTVGNTDRLESTRWSTGLGPGTSAMHSFPVQRDVGEFRVAVAYVTDTDTQVEAGQSTATVVGLTETSATIALDPIPSITSAAFDFAGNALTLETSTGAAYDRIFFEVHDTRAGQTVDWSISAPPGSQRVPFPELPAPFADWAPLESDTFIDMNLFLYELDAWETYADARATPSWKMRENPLFEVDRTASSARQSGAYIYHPL